MTTSPIPAKVSLASSQPATLSALTVATLPMPSVAPASVGLLSLLPQAIRALAVNATNLVLPVSVLTTMTAPPASLDSSKPSVVERVESALTTVLNLTPLLKARAHIVS